MKKWIFIIGSAVLLSLGTMSGFAESTPENPPSDYETTQGEYTLKLGEEAAVNGVYGAEGKLYQLPVVNNISEAFLSPDGQQVAMIFEKSFDKDSIGIMFYNQGSLTAIYRVKDLCLSFMAEKLPEEMVWEDASQRSYDAELNQLTVASKDHSKRIFNMKSGEILVEENPVTIGIYAAVVLFFAILFGIFWFSKYNTLRQVSLEMQRQDAQKSCMERKQQEAAEKTEEE